MENLTEKIAEVIESSTAQYTAQCYELYPSDNGPCLGDLVKAGNSYGIVAGAATAGVEPGRKPIARGRDEATVADVYAASPQLTSLLRSEITVLVTGHRDGSSIRQYLPPQPVSIHDFVYICQPEEIREFGASPGFLPLLLNADTAVPPEELVAAALRKLSAVQEDPRQYLVRAGKELASLLSSDFIRLKTILGRLK